MKKFGLLQKREEDLGIVADKSQQLSKQKAKKGKGVSETALIFSTDWTAEEKDIEIYDGKALVKFNDPIGEKEFIIDQCRPILVKGKGLFGKNKLLYMLKWDKLRPCDFEVSKQLADGNEYIEVGFKPNGNEYRETLMPFNPAFGMQAGDYKDITPDILRQTYDLRFLKHLKNYAGDEKKKLNMSGRTIFLIGIFLFVFILVFIYGYYFYGGF
jgi:hypothetical protein